MNKNILSIIAFVLYLTASFAQSDMDAYKYVIVPNKYDFLKGEDDQYKLNSLTIFLFNKYGFSAFFEDEDYPQDLLLNPCLGVQVQIENNSKLFATRLVIEIKDCYNKVVYSSIEGSTREKNFEKAYQASLRGAFVSFQAMNYSFDPDLVTNLSVAKQIDKPVITENAQNENESSENKEIVAAPVVVVSASTVAETNAKKEPQKSESASTELSKAEVAAVPIVVSETTDSDPAKGAEESVLKSYKNDMISFFLVQQGSELVAYVNSSKDDSYKKGERIGSFSKTSIPNVFRVNWKDKEGVSKQTTGYFDDKGNLKIDINKNGNIEVMLFEVEK